MKYIYALTYLAVANLSFARGFPSFIGEYQGSMSTAGKDVLTYKASGEFKKNGIFAVRKGYSIKFLAKGKMLFRIEYARTTLFGTYRVSSGVIRIRVNGDTTVKGRIRNTSKDFFISIHTKYWRFDDFPFTPTPTPEPAP